MGFFLFVFNKKKELMTNANIFCDFTVSRYKNVEMWQILKKKNEVQFRCFFPIDFLWNFPAYFFSKQICLSLYSFQDKKGQRD